MEIWSEIRREVLTGALSKRAAIAKYGVGWHTLKKMLAHDEPPGYRQAKHRRRQSRSTPSVGSSNASATSTATPVARRW
jgi:hypothetical protein